MALPLKRYICSIVRKVDGKFKPDVVVISALNELYAKMKLCITYNIPDVIPEYKYVSSEYLGEGIKSIRISETNTYDTEDPIFDNFRDNS